MPLAAASSCFTDFFATFVVRVIRNDGNHALMYSTGITVRRIKLDCLGWYSVETAKYQTFFHRRVAGPHHSSFSIPNGMAILRRGPRQTGRRMKKKITISTNISL